MNRQSPYIMWSIAYRDSWFVNWTWKRMMQKTRLEWKRDYARPKR